MGYYYYGGAAADQQKVQEVATKVEYAFADAYAGEKTEAQAVEIAKAEAEKTGVDTSKVVAQARRQAYGSQAYGYSPGKASTSNVIKENGTYRAATQEELKTYKADQEFQAQGREKLERKELQREIIRSLAEKQGKKVQFNNNTVTFIEQQEPKKVTRYNDDPYKTVIQNKSYPLPEEKKGDKVETFFTKRLENLDKTSRDIGDVTKENIFSPKRLEAAKTQMFLFSTSFVAGAYDTARHPVKTSVGIFDFFTLQLRKDIVNREPLFYNFVKTGEELFINLVSRPSQTVGSTAGSATVIGAVGKGISTIKQKYFTTTKISTDTSTYKPVTSQIEKTAPVSKTISKSGTATKFKYGREKVLEVAQGENAPAVSVSKSSVTFGKKNYEVNTVQVGRSVYGTMVSGKETILFKKLDSGELSLKYLSKSGKVVKKATIPYTKENIGFQRQNVITKRELQSTGFDVGTKQGGMETYSTRNLFKQSEFKAQGRSSEFTKNFRDVNKAVFSKAVAKTRQVDTATPQTEITKVGSELNYKTKPANIEYSLQPKYKADVKTYKTISNVETDTAVPYSKMVKRPELKTLRENKFSSNTKYLYEKSRVKIFKGAAKEAATEIGAAVTPGKQAFKDISSTAKEAILVTRSAYKAKVAQIAKAKTVTVQAQEPIVSASTKPQVPISGQDVSTILENQPTASKTIAIVKTKSAIKQVPQTAPVTRVAVEQKIPVPSKTETFTLSPFKTAINSRVGPKTEIKPITETRATTSTATETRAATETKAATETIAETRAATETKAATKTLTNTRTFTGTNINTGKTTTPPPVMAFTSGALANKPGSFKTLVRRQGVFKEIGTFSTAREAIIKGRERVSSTAAASFKIQPINSNPDIRGEAGQLLSRVQFYESRKQPGVFIERREKRIKSPGEKREITFKGILVSKLKRKKRFGVF